MHRDSKPSFPLRLALAATAALLAAPAEGSLVRYDFSGHIDQMTGTGPGVPSYDFTGELIYDDAIALGASHEDSWGRDERSYLSGA